MNITQCQQILYDTIFIRKILQTIGEIGIVIGIIVVFPFLHTPDEISKVNDFAVSIEKGYSTVHTQSESKFHESAAPSSAGIPKVAIQ
ncbi:MAG: hypothetical protein A2583_08920 [Bdellovibrionales bacterium RIFOXYD1_FULL_53_11]|nr:MAG: hypothetical protein A2583_08920 [Bdellovibrionales bacterium RIFOXYD1_FULL_53_11]